MARLTSRLTEVEADRTRLQKQVTSNTAQLDKLRAGVEEARARADSVAAGRAALEAEAETRRKAQVSYRHLLLLRHHLARLGTVCARICASAPRRGYTNCCSATEVSLTHRGAPNLPIIVGLSSLLLPNGHETLVRGLTQSSNDEYAAHNSKLLRWAYWSRK